MREKDIGVKWFNTNFYPKNKTSRAVNYEEGVLPRLRQQCITLFTPWGPRYSWEKRGSVVQKNNKEVSVLEFLADMLSEWRQNMPDKKFEWVFLGADLYGTRINGLPEGVVSTYFKSVESWVSKILPEAKFMLWSDLDPQAEKFRQKVRGDFDEFVTVTTVARAKRTAMAMGKGSDPREYLIERIAEAMLIEKMFQPVKISCVARHKDDKVDWNLPRLYFLPEHLHAPWL